MHAAVTLHVDAEPLEVWELVSDITRMGEYSPEVFEFAVIMRDRPVNTGRDEFAAESAGSVS